MNKIRVIDLLQRIANNEEVPNKIKYENDIFIHVDNYCYYCDESNLILSDRIFAEYSRLNDEIEIIEEKPKKIEKLILEEDDGDIGINGKYLSCQQTEVLANKINEIIDYLLEKESDK